MILELLAIKEINKPVEPPPQPKPQATVQVEKKIEPKKKKRYYTVKKGDTLTKVSKRFRVPVGRVLCANRHIDDPDLILPSERLRIPRKADKLKCPKIKSQGNQGNVFTDHSSIAPSGWYPYGWCTYGAWTLAPWVGQWHDANTWDDMARAEGRTVNGTPVVGAVFVDNGGGVGHVGVVIKVGKGTVTTKEMNYQGFGVWSSRTVPTSSFVYIHP